MGDRHEFRNSLLLGLALTTLSLALHFAPVWETMLNRGAETWDGRPLPHDFIVDCIEEHRSGPEAAFVRRPMTTWSIDLLEAIGLPPTVGFMIIGFGAFLIAGLLVYRIARALGSTAQNALIAQLLFHASPTVLFAWFDPLYTYDEPIQYLALLLALRALLKDRPARFLIAFTIALIARETSILLLPGFYLLMKERGRWRNIIAPLILYAIFLAIWLPNIGVATDSLADFLERPSFFLFNFGTLAMTGETIGYLLMVLVLPVFLLARFARSKAATTADRKLLRAFWTTLLLNTLVVLIAAKAREARLFALPMIIGWPLLGKAIRAELDRLGGIGSFLSFLRKPLLAVGSAVVAAVIFFGVRMLFVLSTGIQQDNLFHEYLIGELLLILLCLYATKHRGRSGLRTA